MPGPGTPVLSPSLKRAEREKEDVTTPPGAARFEGDTPRYIEPRKTTEGTAVSGTPTERPPVPRRSDDAARPPQRPRE
jgi:hypothetical protein